MANTILLKKRSTAGAPNPGDLQFGELAINYGTDGTTGQRLYYKDSTGAIQYIASAAVTASVALNNVTAAVSGTTIANGANNIVWNWQLNGGDTGFKIGETAASTGAGNTLFSVATADGSSADPFKVSIDTSTLVLVDAAGAISLTALSPAAGIGSAVNISAGNSVDDAGGSVGLVGGNGDTGGGDISLNSGASTGTGNGGNIILQTGLGGNGTSGAIGITTGTMSGGTGTGGIDIATGDTDAGGSTAGTIQLIGGAYTGADSGSGAGGSVSITAGNAAGTDNYGGSVSITAGNAANPGNVTIYAGNSTASANPGGNVEIYAGDGNGSGTSGNIILQTIRDNVSGSITIETKGADVGNAGDVKIFTGATGGTGAVHGGNFSVTTGGATVAGSAVAGNVTFTMGVDTTSAYGVFNVVQGTSKLKVDAAGLVQVGGATGTSALNVAGDVELARVIFTDQSTNPFKVNMTTALDGDILVYDTGTSTWVPTTLTTGGTVTSVAATAPASGFTISGSPITTNGTFVFTLNDDLAAVEGLTTNGIAVRTGTSTWTTRTITGTAGNIVVSNGDGISANPTIDLATVGSAIVDQFVKITTDNYGRVTATSAVATGDITALVDSTYVNVAGDTMTGNLTFAGGPSTVTGLPTPTNASDAATKAYVDAAVTGLTWKTAVRVATTAAGTLASDFENGDTVDGVTLATGNRILIKNQSTSSEDGIYIVQASGAPVRATDADTYQELNGAAVFVLEGTVNADTGWTQTAELTGFSGQTWVQFSGSNTYVAGAGLDLLGNVFSVNFGAGITQLPSDEVGIDIYNYPGSAIAFADGTGTRVATVAAAVSGDTLRLFLDGSTLTQSGTGLKVAASGITATELNTSVAGAGLSGGGGTALAVNTTGVSTGIVTDNVVVRSTGTAGQVLRSTGTDGAEATWGALDLANSNAVTGVLAAVNGGTGQSSFAVGDLFYADSTTTIAKLPIGTTDQILRVNAGVPQWATTIDGGLF